MRLLLVEDDTMIGDQDGATCLTIDDSGPGIAPAQRERVFEPVFERFFRGHTRDPSGNGLGLAIANAIALRHHVALRPEELRAAGVDAGLLIEDSTGAAASAGVEPGDVLLAINGTSVKNVEQVRAAVARSDKSVALLIQRGDAPAIGGSVAVRRPMFQVPDFDVVTRRAPGPTFN